jgi:hypothetical protein
VTLREQSDESMLAAVFGIISEAWDRGRGSTAEDDKLERDGLISRAEASDEEDDFIGEIGPLIGDTRPSDNLRGVKSVVLPKNNNVYLPRSMQRIRRISRRYVYCT